MRLAVVLAGALAIAAGGAARGLPSPAHVVVIVFENKDASQINARSAPTFTALGRRYARLTNYVAVTHPSLPNYLALVSGSTHGITNDCTACSVPGDSIGDQLAREGRSWAAYAEDYPSGRGFAKKHVPFLYFRRGTNHVFPLSRFNLQNLPDFAFVVPNLCHDMHDCSVATGDAWLKRFVTPLLRVPDTVVFVVFDEGTSSNHVAALALGTAVRPRSAFVQRVNHYGLLRTIEEMWGLPPLGAAATAKPIVGIWLEG
jgi:phosphatidylinositol-3-phosphatase